MAVGPRIERVRTDEHGARAFGFVEAEENIGEAEDRNAAFVAPADGLGQSMVGATANQPPSVTRNGRLNGGFPSRGLRPPDAWDADT